MNYARSLVGTSLSIGVLAVACSLGPPRTAADVLARAVRAHGGDKLTRWQTLTLTGTVEMSDGVTYNAAYSVLAKLPDRLRVEQDLTADRGRAFYEYYLNGGVAWSRRNLVPARADPARLQRWLKQCFGVAYYAKHAKKTSLKPDGAVEWMIRDGSSESSWKGVDTIPAFVVEVTTDEGATVELFFDKKRFYLLQEITPEVRRLFRDFKTFQGVVWPTRVLEIARNQKTEAYTPYEFKDVKYNLPIEDWVFTEDMPEKGK